jgi:hypothetical protein
MAFFTRGAVYDDASPRSPTTAPCRGPGQSQGRLEVDPGEHRLRAITPGGAVEYLGQPACDLAEPQLGGAALGGEHATLDVAQRAAIGGDHAVAADAAARVDAEDSHVGGTYLVAVTAGRPAGPPPLQPPSPDGH